MPLLKSSIKTGNILNIELPLKYGQSISGHICQGHVDTTAKVNKIVKYGKSVVYDFSIKKNLIKSLIDKASILVNGVSLTISKVTKILVRIFYNIIYFWINSLFK